MRRLLLALMILLLPLRGWMGDAMAVQDMHRGGHHMENATLSIASNAHEHSGMVTLEHDDVPPELEHSHAACHLCDVCHSAAIAVTCMDLSLGHAPTALPVGQVPIDTSAEVALGQKPPIS
jgi:hypothetical protein